MMNEATHQMHIVIVGGGSGGLELVSRLARKYRKNPDVAITLVDNSLTHIWKPHYHEIAAGTLSTEHGINYLLHAAKNGYEFRYGELVGFDQDAKTITIKTDLSETNAQISKLNYDVLVIAIGSITNHFNIPGISEYCYTLDTLAQTQLFHEALLQQLLKSQYQPDQPLKIVIVGGGATGIELAAELHYALQLVVKHGFPHFHPEKDVSISLIEALPKLLNHIKGKLPQQVEDFLECLPIELHCNEQVKQVTADRIITRSDLQLPYDLAVWVAGIKAPEVLAKLKPLATNSISQLMVNQSLQTTLDPHVFAFGDCAHCDQKNTDQPVPPRAQAANQQARFLAHEIPKYLAGKPLATFKYHDYGSLISLSSGGGIGELMVRMLGEFKVHGFLARCFYRTLHFTHRVNTLGLWNVLIQSLADRLTRRTRSRLKLH